ncbi:MAG: hypothetical protein RJA70_1439 [Pseudomonadota bacterium]|jgi:hypothetical protein
MQAHPIAPVRSASDDAETQNQGPAFRRLPTLAIASPATTLPRAHAGTQRELRPSAPQVYMWLVQRANTSGTRPAAIPGSTALCSASETVAGECSLRAPHAEFTTARASNRTGRRVRIGLR